MIILFQNLVCFQQYSSRHRKAIRQLRASSLVDSSGLVPLLLLPAPGQAGKACSASCVLFSNLCKNSFDLTAESFWYQLKSPTIPEAIRHPTCETQDLLCFFSAISAIQQQTPQGNTTDTGTVAAGRQRPRAPITPAGPAPSR